MQRSPNVPPIIALPPNTVSAPVGSLGSYLSKFNGFLVFQTASDALLHDILDVLKVQISFELCTWNCYDPRFRFCITRRTRHTNSPFSNNRTGLTTPCTNSTGLFWPTERIDTQRPRKCPYKSKACEKTSIGCSPTPFVALSAVVSSHHCSRSRPEYALLIVDPRPGVLNSDRDGKAIFPQA